MKKIIYISPDGVQTPDFFSTFYEPFWEAGLSKTDNVEEAHIAFVDLFSNIHPVKIPRNKKLIFWDATDYGAMSKEVFDPTFYDELNGATKIVYFMRKVDKTKTYPDYVYPLELIHYPNCDFPITTEEELFSRPYDFCFIGNTSPARLNLTTTLSNYFKCDFSIGKERIPYGQWLGRHRNAKFYIESCGGGFGSERPYQLTTIAPQLRNSSNLLRVNDFQDKADCLQVNESPLWEDICKIKEYLSDSKKLYWLYLSGVNKVRNFYTAAYRANYILSILKQQEIL